jgi:D-3-phosphoglycerate dehydrogenase / 2-oxoglutarate reductase
MPKVLISDKMSPLAEQVFKDRGIEVDVTTGMTPEELIACIGDYDGLAVRSSTKAKTEIIEAATNLKVIGRAGIGVDNIDVATATSQGVLVMNTPFGNSTTTAEHAIAMILSLARDIPLANASTHLGKWEKSRFMGMEVTGKTLGIIGCGNIGSIVADRAQGLKMKVVGYDPYLSPDRAKELGIEKLELDDLMARADIITLHTPLTDATRDIINADSLAKTKKGVKIINCARGGLVVEADLKKAIDDGQVSGAALDVLSAEPATESIFFGMENVIITPHLGAATEEAQEKVAEQVAEQMADYLLTGAVTNALNMPSLSAEEAPRLKPYMKLAEQLGSFAGQATMTAIKSVTIEYLGQVAELNTKPLTAVILQGLLSPLMESVNIVSAPSVAKDRNIDITEVHKEKGGAYQTLINLTVTTEAQTRNVAGTLFYSDQPRIIQIKGIPVDATLAPFMLYITNHDKPGFIGGLGSLLGDEGINIATFNLGRAKQGGDAIALVEVDQPPSPEILQKIHDLPQVMTVRPMTF